MAKYILAILFSFVTVSYATISCNFEQDMCGWSQNQSETYIWKRNANSSGSGFSIPYAYEGLYYAYISSANYKHNTDYGRLTSPVFSISSMSNLTFWYFDYGMFGNLSLYIKKNNELNLIWSHHSKGAMEGDKWAQAILTMIPENEIQLMFEGHFASAKTYYLGLDFIVLESEKAETTTFKIPTTMKTSTQTSPSTPKSTTFSQSPTTSPPKTSSQSPTTNPPKTSSQSPTTNTPKISSQSPTTNPPKTSSQSPTTNPPKTSSQSPTTNPPKTSSQSPTTNPSKTSSQSPTSPEVSSQTPKTNPQTTHKTSPEVSSQTSISNSSSSQKTTPESSSQTSKPHTTLPPQSTTPDGISPLQSSFSLTMLSFVLTLVCTVIIV